MKLEKITNSRNQTIIFLDIAKNIPSVTLIDKVYIDKLYLKYSTAILISAVTNAINEMPHLNCMVKYGTDNKIISMKNISARLTISDKKNNGIKGVYSTLLNNVKNESTIDIYNKILEIKRKGIKGLESYNKVILLQKLPYHISKFLVKTMLYLFPKKQSELFGSFTVTSFGKNSQKICIPISGSTFTFTLGSIQNIDSNNPFLNIVMIFDHRIIDGIEASILLDKIKDNFAIYLLKIKEEINVQPEPK